MSIRQLTGRVPVRLSGEPLTDGSVIAMAARLEIGNSILSLCPGDLTAPAQRVDRANIASAPGGGVLMRAPRAVSPWIASAATPPAHRAAPGDAAGSGLLPAILALGGSGLLAVLVHQPMFLLFGAIGAFAAFGTWGGQQIHVFRRRRHDTAARHTELARFAHSIAEQREGFVEHHLTNTSTPVSARRAIEGPTADLWARRGTHPDGFAVSMGEGSVAWSPALDESSIGANRAGGDLATMSLLADLPIVADIGPPLSACRPWTSGFHGRHRPLDLDAACRQLRPCGCAVCRCHR